VIHKNTEQLIHKYVITEKMSKFEFTVWTNEGEHGKNKTWVFSGIGSIR